MSISVSQIKFIKSLQQKKQRLQTSLFVVEGEKLVAEAITSDFEIESIYRRDEIGENAMGRISSLASPSPILAVVRQKQILTEEIKLAKGNIYLMLDGIKDPGNMGTIIRLADWFGISAVFCSENCVELYNPKTVQATMGAIFRVPVVYGDLCSTITMVERMGLPVFGTFLDGKAITSDRNTLSTMQAGCVVVLGSESFGISAEVASAIDKKRHILIPSFDKAGREKPIGDKQGCESLNVAMAGAAILSILRTM